MARLAKCQKWARKVVYVMSKLQCVSQLKQKKTPRPSLVNFSPLLPLLNVALQVVHQALLHLQGRKSVREVDHCPAISLASFSVTSLEFKKLWALEVTANVRKNKGLTGRLRRTRLESDLNQVWKSRKRSGY